MKIQGPGKIPGQVLKTAAAAASLTACSQALYAAAYPENHGHLGFIALTIRAAIIVNESFLRQPHARCRRGQKLPGYQRDNLVLAAVATASMARTSSRPAVSASTGRSREHVPSPCTSGAAYLDISALGGRGVRESQLVLDSNRQAG